ncbi:O-glucosyltransferase rumi homolog [Phoenix dactylifera]|uniref:O-glucosyltransferase rumi homolog n=1 Tax=Phoenix dactylifera TaxID=42345 RepID=A0A8B8ZKC7_PHODC|nr:O-glucosyltransferase rumi homolog [Phoenix dactylifera]
MDPAEPAGKTTFRQIKKSRKNSEAAAAAAGSSSGGAVLLFFLLAILFGAFISTFCWMNSESFGSITATITMAQNLIIPPTAPHTQTPPTPKPKAKPKAKPPAIPFTCPAGNGTATRICPSPPLPPLPDSSLSPSPSCPDYFRWIHEDLRPWKSTGITQEMVERARETAHFRLVILHGRVYMERYRRSFQTRDVFTLWGILQLLRRYPDRIPDLELMFNTHDWPVVQAGRNASAPPPLFHYCADDSALDIVFPDWTFWGWPEINLKPWELLNRELKEGNERVRWMDREPYAYWKGNPAVAATRKDLLKCNVSEAHDWNARIYALNWRKETQIGYKESDLGSQCIHRYKIYIEGAAWSVSEKYILACNSLTLLVKPRYYDFFTRSLMPLQHYWPVRSDDKCRSIKFAVDWGNSHKQKAQAIGKEASNFIQEKLKMEYVYDYMLHLLTEYSKLLRYKPTRPRKAIELCSKSMACPAKALEKKFMMESMVKSPHDSAPCKLPPPFKPVELKMLERRKAAAIKQVEMWEQRA